MTISRAGALAVVTTLMAALARPAGAQSRDINTYVLFALQELRTKGPTLQNGDIGVNQPNGLLAVSPHGQIDAPHSQIVTDYFRSPVTSRCQALFSRPVSPAMTACGPASPVALPIVADPLKACGFPAAFPACDASKPVVVVDGRTESLAPGTYGDVRVLGGSTLVFTGGDYRFCSLRVSPHGNLFVQRPATIEVTTAVNLSNNVFLGPDPAAAQPISPRDVQLFVNGGSVHFSGHAEVRAALCAPAALLRLTHEAHLVGMFVAGRIRTERITGESPPTTSTTTTTTTMPAATSTSTTTTPPTTAPVPPDCSKLCGNGRIDPECGEKCDGHDFGGATCPGDSAGGAFTSPAGAFLACKPDCTIDFDGCPNALLCGDGVRQPFEQCDPVALVSGCPAGKVCGAAGTPVGCRCVPPEICGNCLDDDGNGDTDFEDAACCPEGRAFRMGISRARLRPRGAVSMLRLRTTLAESGLSTVNPRKQDVFVQIRPPGGADVFCAQLPADKFMKIRRGFSFWDKKHVVTSAKGINDAKVMIRRNGTVRFRALGRRAQLRTPASGPLQLTVGFHDAQAGDTANSCSTETPAFRTGRRGRLIAP
jgi:hypothetical protein